MTLESITAVAVLCSLGSGLVALIPWCNTFWARYGVFIPLFASGLLSSVVALMTLVDGPSIEIVLPFGLPWLNWHLRLDPLAGFFLGVIGIVTMAVAMFGPAYVRSYQQGQYSLGVLGIFTGLFVGGMQMVVLAADAFSFMVSWELMSVSSYFLVAFEHHHAANRRAAFLYLLMAQAGALLILLCFGVLAGFADEFTFAAFRQAQISPSWASLAFALGLAGFGMKAGIVPLHVWLPEAHPVAPSHISALMSGVMLKVAIYGFVRLLFDLLPGPTWEWGVVLLVFGSVTALYGVLYALMQHDLKRLLAYHSVENIGIIYIGLGLAAIFTGSGHPGLGVLGLLAALYHTLNHALFKSLLFLGAGVIVQRGHERNLEHMGGLLKRLPWTGLFFLVGCISISALPPFNGFVSEWLTFQTALQATALDSGILRAIIPIAAAMLALTGALAAACFVKVYGIAFLGQSRSRHVRRASEAKIGMLGAQGLLAGLCLIFGVLPTTTIIGLGRVTGDLLGVPIAAATSRGWLWLTPVAPEIASYSAPLVLLGVLIALAAWAAVWLFLRGRRRIRPVPRQGAWDCGFGPLTARMQYSATAFAMPIRWIFRPVWRFDEEQTREMNARLPTKAEKLGYRIHAEDIAWDWLYLPLERWVTLAARRVSRLQTGNLRHYLAYSFVTLVILLWLIS
ncbi:MAG TPA: hydrogenase 4 subunit B [Gammaproteobacteria bacterium]|nr:hydrogenase 4 subunit B [Gammaproteobacteria bacterium]